jgi:hypothetical protein
MTDVPTTQARTAASRAFLLPMWGYVFFVPLPVGRWAPDGLGWLLLLLGLLAIGKSYRAVRVVVPLVVAGLAVWALAVLLPIACGSDPVLRGLLILRWGLLAAVSWMLGGAAAALAESAQMPAVAASARWRRWACVVTFLLLAAAPLVPPRHQLVLAAAFLIAAVAAITITIGLMSRIVRLGSLPLGGEAPDPLLEAERPAEGADEGRAVSGE